MHDKQAACAKAAGGTPAPQSRAGRAAEALEHLPPDQLVDDILFKERRIIEIMGEIKKVLAGAGK